MLRTPEEQRLDATPFDYGKHKGKTRDEVADADPQYLVWCYGNVTNRDTCSFPLATKCGYRELRGFDNRTRDIPLADRNERSREYKPPFDNHNHAPASSFDDMDDDIPF